ncbi:MAG: STT3 domain-containing protein [Deferribacterales bacterium]
MSEYKRGHRKIGVLFFALLLVMAYLANTAVRYRQHTDILDSAYHRAAGHVILVSNDGYRWLRYAKEIADGSFVSGKDPLSTGTPFPFTPLISLLTEKTASAAGLDLETASSLLTVFLSGLFVFPLGIFLYLNGMPSAAIGGAVTGGLCMAYLGRTTAFQADTDMLNLFFPLTVILFIYLAGRGKTLLYSALAGIFCWLHYRWYAHAGFAVVWLVMLSLHLLIVCKNKKMVLYSVAVFIIFCSPFQLALGFKGLIGFMTDAGRFYPADVAELGVKSFWDNMRLITLDGYSALAGLVLFAVTFRRIYLLAPLFLLGCLMFFKGQRFGMYLGVFAGIGFGVLFSYVFRRAGRFGEALSMSSAFFFAFAVSAVYFVPAPYVEKEVFEDFAKLDIPKGANVVTQWDNGFILEYLKGVRAAADGTSQFKEGWYMSQKLLASAQPDRTLLKTIGGGKDVWLVLTEGVPFKGGSHGYFSSDGLNFTNIEHNSDSGLKLHRNGAYFSVFNNKTENSIFGKTLIIGSSDIGCFKRIYRNYPFIAVYKAEGGCIIGK